MRHAATLMMIFVIAFMAIAGHHHALAHEHVPAHETTAQIAHGPGCDHERAALMADMADVANLPNLPTGMKDAASSSSCCGKAICACLAGACHLTFAPSPAAISLLPDRKARTTQPRPAVDEGAESALSRGLSRPPDAGIIRLLQLV